MSKEEFEGKFNFTGLSPELVEQLRTLFRLAIPQLEPDEEERELQDLAKELVVMKTMKKAH